MTPYPSNEVDWYAESVLNGKPAGKYHRLACARHRVDRMREGTPGFPYQFEWKQADRFLNTFCRKLKHYKGRQFAGQPFIPTPVQVFRLGSIFGWREMTSGLRRFTTAYNELPRKSGKSFEAAAVGLYVTFFEGEAGAEGYCLATKEHQARIVFDAMKRLVKSSGLSDRIKVNVKNLNRELLAQKLEPIGSDSDTTDGLNPHFIGVDELHAWKFRALLDVMESATGARVNPLIFQITTAGNDLVSVCGDQHTYACQILDGTLQDDPSTVSFFAFIAAADPDDDPFAESTWIKANPHWGISVEPEDMRKLAAKAQQMPSAAAEFKQKRLNLWVNADEPWLSLEGWRKGQSSWDPESLEHESCYIGIDLASKIDLCAMAALFPPTPGRPTWRVLTYAWTPKDTLIDRARRDRAPYPVWVDQGYLYAASGSSIDQELVRSKIIELRSMYDIEKIGFDPWHYEHISKQLINEDGFAEQDIIPIPQNYHGMSAACLSFEADVLGGLVDAGGSPLATWCIGNAVVQRDGKDNIYPVKKRSRGRIDPLMAMLIARALSIKDQPQAQPQYQALVFGMRT